MHTHVNVEYKYTAFRKQMPNFNGLFGSNTTADLGAPLIADLTVPAADALDETYLFRGFTSRWTHKLTCFQHAFGIHERDHIVKFVVAVQLGFLARIEMLETGGDYNATRLNLLFSLNSFQTDLEGRSRAGGMDHFRRGPDVDQFIVFNSLNHFSHCLLGVHHVRRQC